MLFRSRLSRLEDLLAQSLEKTVPLPQQSDKDAMPFDSPSSLDDLVLHMEEMMDGKIEQANKEWASKFHQVHEKTHAALINYTNDRWEALDKKMGAQFELFTARSERWPELMEKIDKVLDTCHQRQCPPEGAVGTPGKKQKLIAPSPPISPGDEVTLE